MAQSRRRKSVIMNTPSWLPDVMDLSDFGGNWDDYVESIYAAFYDDFHKSNIVFDGVNLSAKKHPEINGKSATFWHIITSGEVESERVPDLERCKRVLWPRAIIENCTDSVVLRWPSSKHKNRTLLWLKEFDYMVVIEHRNGYCMLWTAFYVNSGHMRRKYQKEYNSHINSSQSAANT